MKMAHYFNQMTDANRKHSYINGLQVCLKRAQPAESQAPGRIHGCVTGFGHRLVHRFGGQVPSSQAAA